MNGEVWVVAFIGEEGGDSGSVTRSVVVDEFRDRKERGPVVLLIVAVAAEVLFQRLVNVFGLAVAFRVISGSEVKIHVKGFTESAEEVGDKFGAAVGGDVEWYSVF